MSLVGLESRLAIDALAKWAPVGSTRSLAAARAARAGPDPAGAADAITALLADSSPLIS